MDYKKELKKLTSDYKKYRRLQDRKKKLMNKSTMRPDQKNIKPMVALLANITGLLKDMDEHTDLILAEMKKDGIANIKSADKHYIN